MKTIAGIKDGSVKRWYKGLHIGASGTGKTTLASTFPKCLFCITEPSGEETFLNQPHLSKNIVGWEHFIPQSIEQSNKTFEELDKFCLLARDMASKGEIETFVLDNITYLAENRWLYMNQYEIQYSNQNKIDTLKMYGALARWMYQFVLMKILTIPCNVVVNVHEQLESDEAMAKKPDKTTPIVPNILGGFRNQAEGMFSCVFYLTKSFSNGKYIYKVQTNKGNQRNAKCRYNLPAVIENVSYQTIMNAINQTKNGGK